MNGTHATDRQRLDWLLVEFVRNTPGVVHGIVVAGDGLQLAASEGIERGLGDRVSALTSGLVSLADSAARSFQAGPMQQAIIEMAGGYLFVTPISGASSLAVFTTPDCDMGMVGYEMTLLADRVGHVLTPARRPAAAEFGRSMAR